MKKGGTVGGARRKHPAKRLLCLPSRAIMFLCYKVGCKECKRVIVTGEIAGKTALCPWFGAVQRHAPDPGPRSVTHRRAAWRQRIEAVPDEVR